MSKETETRAIYLHIDALVLHGFGHVDEAALTTALQDALRRKLNATPTLGNAALPRVHAVVTLPACCGMEYLGSTLGQTLAAVIEERGAPDVRRDSSRGDVRG